VSLLGGSACLGVVFLATGCNDDPNFLTVAGTIEIREIALAPLSGGRIERLLHEEGDTVHVGDTIVVLVQPGLEERIAEAEARHAAALAHVRDLEAGARPQELEVARAALQGALADSVHTWTDFERISALREQDILTPAQLDAARSAAAGAAARVRQARETLDLAGAGARAFQLGAARDEAAAIGASIRALEAQKSELVLKAPATGVLLLRLSEAGEVVGAGVPVAVMGITGEPWVRAFVGYEEIPRVLLGAPVRVKVSAYPESVFTGEVVEISTRAEFVPRAALTERERADLVYAIRVGLDDTGGRLKAGMPVDLEIDLAPPLSAGDEQLP
jgi:HlyD family secretion protein